MEKAMNLSSCERRVLRPKHVSLTHWMRRNWDVHGIKSIISKCEVEPRVGSLPPELRALVPHQDMTHYTARFHDILTDFIVENYYTIKNAPRYQMVPFNAARSLFGTHCTIEFMGHNNSGPARWHGEVGMICRISFPMINADYALKIYYPGSQIYYGHGPMFEIPTAFAAVHSEPRDNVPVYMASFVGDGYMLSKWYWQKLGAKEFCRHNENEFFSTSNREARTRNYANGCRIDYGETVLTMYGGAPYRVRKLVRTISQYAANKNEHAIRELYAGVKNLQNRRELERAVEIVCLEAYVKSQTEIQQFMSRDWQK